MFTNPERSSIRSQLVELARADLSVVGAALVGSGARDAEDDWSDIDLALQLAPGADEPAVVEDWSESVSKIGGGVSDTLDVLAGGVRYRVFVLRSSLQIDLSFWPFEQFRATGGEPFRLLFGTPAEAVAPGPIDTGRVIGMGWLHAIHARSAVARGRLWQAAGMLEELRSSLITLKCERVGLNSWHGRGVDQLPAADLNELHKSHPQQITPTALDSCRRYLTTRFLEEVERHDPERATRLADPFRELVRAIVTD